MNVNADNFQVHENSLHLYRGFSRKDGSRAYGVRVDVSAEVEIGFHKPVNVKQRVRGVVEYDQEAGQWVLRVRDTFYSVPVPPMHVAAPSPESLGELRPKSSVGRVCPCGRHRIGAK